MSAPDCYANPMTAVELKAARAAGVRPQAPRADLCLANLYGANLCGADLRGANLPEWDRLVALLAQGASRFPGCSHDPPPTRPRRRHLHREGTLMTDYTNAYTNAANDYATSYAPAGGYRPRYLPSDRAQKYARSLHYKGISPVEIAAEGFDAGLAAAASDALATITPRTISTSAELDALPVGEGVFDRDGDHWQKLSSNRWKRPSGANGVSSFHLSTFAPLTLLVPATAAPEPVRLLDPEDPRIKPGARVRVVLEATVSADPWGELRSDWVSSHIKGTYKVTEGVYLLAEAPDPDAELVAALEEGETGWVADQWREVIAKARKAGYDLTPRADSALVVEKWGAVNAERTES